MGLEYSSQFNIRMLVMESLDMDFGEGAVFVDDKNKSMTVGKRASTLLIFIRNTDSPHFLALL